MFFSCQVVDWVNFKPAYTVCFGAPLEAGESIVAIVACQPARRAGVSVKRIRRRAIFSWCWRDLLRGSAFFAIAVSGGKLFHSIFPRPRKFYPHCPETMRAAHGAEIAKALIFIGLSAIFRGARGSGIVLALVWVGQRDT
jgi:hypothetical protein